MTSPQLPLIEIGFVALTFVYFYLFIKAIAKGINQTSWDKSRQRRSIVIIISILVVWTLFVSLWSLSGIMRDFSLFPVNFLPVIAIPLISVIITLFSPALGTILRNVDQATLLRLQSFRIFVEILLWALFVIHVLPVQMTFEGRNFDILAGLTGPIIAWLLLKGKISRIGLMIWNLFGLALLINIVTVAILSTPSPIRVFMNEPANTIVAYFPISWLPGLLVPLAYTLHFFSLKKLAQADR